MKIRRLIFLTCKCVSIHLFSTPCILFRVTECFCWSFPSAKGRLCLNSPWCIDEKHYRQPRSTVIIKYNKNRRREIADSSPFKMLERRRILQETLFFVFSPAKKYCTVVTSKHKTRAPLKEFVLQWQQHIDKSKNVLASSVARTGKFFF